MMQMWPPIRVTCREGQVRRDGRVGDVTSGLGTQMASFVQTKRRFLKGLLSATCKYTQSKGAFLCSLVPASGQIPVRDGPLPLLQGRAPDGT
jgi:hypothetical protein